MPRTVRWSRRQKPGTTSAARPLPLSGRERSSGIRQELVAQVRQAIHAGDYDTPAKLELALERMLDQVDGD